VSIRLGNGLGGFSGTTNVSVGSGPISVAIGDFDEDGLQDFAAANGSFATTVSIRLGDGSVLANTAGAASISPTACNNTAITNITHITTGATGIGIGTATRLPNGVTAAFAANTITISGTPTEAGTFNYSIPLTGGCGTVVFATGTITVTTNNTTAASATPNLSINTALPAITHITTGATGIAGNGVSGVNGLPAGVSAAWAGNTITISGTPTASGTFNYSIPLTGGCGTVNATGTITVTDMTTWYLDADGDGFGRTTNGIQSILQPAGFVSNNADCNDRNNTFYPGAPELCDGLDNNCDGQVDEGASGTKTWYLDEDGDGFGRTTNTIQSCVQPTGYVENNTDCNDRDNTFYPGAPELCDGLDNNCDGQIDEGASGTKTWYLDEDGDGFGRTTNTRISCVQPTGFVENNTDCNDRDKTIFPGAPELCDGKDNNCNGLVDDGLPDTKVWYQDVDADGFGARTRRKTSCPQPEGYVADSTDCRDNDNTVYPGAPELCDGKDNDCNGKIDNGAPGTRTWYFDGDGDGRGGTSTLVACAQPVGFVDNTDDCNDRDKTIYPGAPELCDGKDNNCNGLVDDGLPDTKVWYQDVDADGFGARTRRKTSCSQPEGYVADSTDCRDNDNTVYPGAPELCDGKDNDCNGLRDDGAPGTRTWYFDGDGDGRGGTSTLVACAQPVGFVDNNTDCKDNDNTIYPGAPELCDGKDNNCNGLVDDACGLIVTSNPTTSLLSSKTIVEPAAPILEARLWPNPARNELMVALDAFAPNQKLSITMMQADGKVQQSQTLTPAVKGQQVRLDVSRSVGGFYLLQIKQNGLSVTKRFIIIK
jgi:hypothetical protein